jgi:hypothetical protein
VNQDENSRNLLREINMDRRILELAMEALLQKKAQVDREIAEISAQLGNPAATDTVSLGKRRKFTAAQRKAMSAKMKAAWAKRKAAKK